MNDSSDELDDFEDLDDKSFLVKVESYVEELEATLQKDKHFKGTLVNSCMHMGCCVYTRRSKLGNCRLRRQLFPSPISSKLFDLSHRAYFSKILFLEFLKFLEFL